MSTDRRVTGEYPPAPVYVNGAMPHPGAARRERERSATRLAQFTTNYDRKDPAAILAIAGQLVCVSVEGGTLTVDVLVGEDDRHVLDIGPDGIVPIRVQVESATVYESKDADR